jgi:hypothetical protein
MFMRKRFTEFAGPNLCFPPVGRRSLLRSLWEHDGLEVAAGGDLTLTVAHF